MYLKYRTLQNEVIMSVYIIAGISTAAVIAAAIILWKISRWILFPVQVILFMILLFIGVEVFSEFCRNSGNSELKKIHSEITFCKSRIKRNVVLWIREISR